jgi:hypothetical protein
MGYQGRSSDVSAVFRGVCADSRRLKTLSSQAYLVEHRVGLSANGAQRFESRDDGKKTNNNQSPISRSRGMHPNPETEPPDGEPSEDFGVWPLVGEIIGSCLIVGGFICVGVGGGRYADGKDVSACAYAMSGLVMVFLGLFFTV